MQLKFVLGKVLKPPLILLISGLIGLAIIGYQPRFGHLLASLSLVSLWLLSTPAVGFAIYRLAEEYPALTLDTPIVGDAIVILGCGRSRDDSPEWGGSALTDIAWDRVAYGATLARRTGLPIAITGKDFEARGMRNALKQAFEIEPRWVDSSAGDTWENARHMATILRTVPVNQILLVTHSCHMGRAVKEFEAAGFRVVPAPVVVRPSSGRGIYAWLPRVEDLQYADMGLQNLIARPVSAMLRRWRS